LLVCVGHGEQRVTPYGESQICYAFAKVMDSLLLLEVMRGRVEFLQPVTWVLVISLESTSHDDAAAPLLLTSHVRAIIACFECQNNSDWPLPRVLCKPFAILYTPASQQLKS